MECEVGIALRGEVYGKLDSKKIPANGTIKLTFKVKNAGKLDGDEVAQVYFRHVRSSVPQMPAPHKCCGEIFRPNIENQR